MAHITVVYLQIQEGDMVEILLLVMEGTFQVLMEEMLQLVLVVVGVGVVHQQKGVLHIMVAQAVQE